MDIRQLEQIDVIVRHKSIGKAADALNIAQSTLSTSINKMEEYFGERIFIRSKKGVVLTDFGREVYSEAGYITNKINLLQASAKKGIGQRQTLSVSNGYSLLGKDVFTELYMDYHKKNVKFIMKDCSIMESSKNVITGLSEIALVRVIKDFKDVYTRSLKNRGLEFIPLDEKNLCAVVGPGNPLFYMENNYTKYEDLMNFPFAVLHDEEGEFSTKQFFTDLKRQKANIAIGSVSHLMDVIRKTDAFTLDVYKEKGMDNEWYKGVRYIPLVDPVLKCEFGYIQKEGAELTPLCQEYLDAIVNRINQWWSKDKI